MPPSGFNPTAVKSASSFVQECFNDLEQEVRDGKHVSFEVALDYELGQLEKALSKPHTLLNESVRGALLFIKGCYSSLGEKVANAPLQDLKSTMMNEITHLEEILTKLHIDSQGNLVEK